MRKSPLILTGVVALVLASIGANPALAGQPDYDSIAHKIVNYSLEVQPGEVVIITGTPAELELLEALQVATSKAGGKPTLELDLPRANKRALMETPIEYLNLTPTYSIAKMRLADCFINVGSTQDPTLLADVPEERLAATRKASAPVNQAFRRAHFRSVGVGQTGGIPTKAYAESKGADYETMLSSFWKAVDADYDQLQQSANTLASTLAPGSRVRVTSPSGTDIRFRIDNTPARTNAGRSAENVSASGPAQVWLPAGEAYASIQPTSASGTIVVPKMTFRGVAVENLEMVFDNGRMTSMTSKNGKILKDYVKATSGDVDVLSIVDIGLNPHSRTPEGSDYYSWEMGGMVTLGMGSNSWAGGSVESGGSLSFHLVGATVSVDGDNLVSEGQLEVPRRVSKK